MSTPDPEVDPLYGDKPWLPNAKETEREALVAIVRSNRSVNVPDAILAAGFRRLSESEIRRDLTVRPNPPMPSERELLDLYLNGGVKSVWRAGCDAGMVAE